MILHLDEYWGSFPTPHIDVTNSENSYRVFVVAICCNVRWQGGNASVKPMSAYHLFPCLGNKILILDPYVFSW
jgi:hypothetical protein